MNHNIVYAKVIEKIEEAKKNNVKSLSVYKMASEILETELKYQKKTGTFKLKKIQTIHVMVMEILVELGYDIKIGDNIYKTKKK